MSYIRRYRKSEEVNFWPGFVDALSSILLVVLFTLVVFMVGQYYLSIKVKNQESNLAAQSEALQKERSFRNNLLEKLHTASLTQSKLKHELIQSLQREDQLSDSLENAKRTLKTAYVDNQALKQMLSTLTQEKKGLTQELEDIKLKQAEVQHLIDMAKHRSQFLAEFSRVFANTPGLRRQGDRFVFDSNLLFPSGSATLTPKGKAQIRKIALIIQQVEKDIPSHVSWVLRIDGHTDSVPIYNQQFKSNWELSVARAMSVLKELEKNGIPAHRLAATGFGEHHPVYKGAPHAENRRIEIRLDTM